MFCPRCATQNELEQSYCRQCGQSLDVVHLALEGRAIQSLEQIRRSQKWLGGGTSALLAFDLIALSFLVIGFVIHSQEFAFIALINLLLGSLIGLPFICIAQASLKRATRLLLKAPAEAHQLINQTQSTKTPPTADLTLKFSNPPIPPSVAERTTVNLKSHDALTRK